MEDDFYCREILSGKTDIEVFDQSHTVLAYYHTKPFWEHHVVVVPKEHVDSFLTLEDDLLLVDLDEMKKKVAHHFLKEYGSCCIETHIGESQSTKHLHYHVHAGKRIRE